MTRIEAEKHIASLYGLPNHLSGPTADDIALDVMSEMGAKAFTDAAIIKIAKAQIRQNEANRQ